MKGKKSQFICGNCGAQFPKWLGRCSDCGEWNSLTEENLPDPGDRRTIAPNTRAAAIRPLPEVAQQTEKRIPSDISELDRVLGGGLVPGSLVLLSGDPGIGKSTLLLQTLFALAKKGSRVLYASGEESSTQIRLRAERLDTLHPNILLTNENDLEVILAGVKETKPQVLVIDSIQTVFSPRFPSSPGSVTQIRECTNLLLEPSKVQGITTFVIGHVTKEGAIAGPKILEHLVDTVLHLEGDTTSGYRILRSVKNRFGSTGEIGVFAMHGDGLSEVKNPSALFVEGHRSGVPGAAIAVSMEGSRPLLVEIQALVGRSNLAVARRTVTGIDTNRLAILVAVLEKHGGLYLSQNDIYASLAGGLKLAEPALDLALAVAVASSHREKALAGRFAYFGEIGLAGEIRPVSHPLPRLLEAQKMGFHRVYLPMRNYKNEKARIDALGDDLQVYPVEHIREVITLE